MLALRSNGSDFHNYPSSVEAVRFSSSRFEANDMHYARADAVARTDRFAVTARVSAESSPHVSAELDHQ